MNDLVHLGPGGGSKSEQLKVASNFLHGTIAESLAEGGTRFSEDDLQLLKFHGSYQQDDRDLRPARKAAGLDKAYSFMVRSRIPGGALTSEQFEVLDDIAQRYGNGSVRLTTRQSVQLHGVLKGDLRATIASINASLLSTLAACGDVNRNVMACSAPLPGRPHEQMTALARTLALALAPRTKAYHEIWIDGEKAVSSQEEDVEPMYGASYMPRKFKIGVALDTDNCIDIYTQDIGYVAHVENGDIFGYTLLIGGGMGATHGKAETYPRLATPLCFIPVGEEVELAKTILSVQRDYGDRQNRKHARMKYVVEERGTAWFLAQVEERLGRTLAPPREFTFPRADDHLGWHRQADGRWFFGLSILNGRVIDTARNRVAGALRETIARFRPNLRITPQQNLIIGDIADEARAQLESLLVEHGLVTDVAKLGIERSAMACPALPTCGLAVAESERTFPALLAEIEAVLRDLGIDEEPPTIRMTGCPNGCARPRMGHIGIVGRSAGLYDVLVGGDRPNTRMNALYKSAVKRDALAETLRPLFALWRDERIGDEDFGDFCYRIGVDALNERASLDLAPLG